MEATDRIKGMACLAGTLGLLLTLSLFAVLGPETIVLPLLTWPLVMLSLASLANEIVGKAGQ